MAKLATKSIKLGMLVVDELSGFTGVVIARAEYLYGCVRAEVQPKRCERSGSLIEPVWFDITRLIPLKNPEETVAEPIDKPEVTGGPERSVPSRDP